MNPRNKSKNFGAGIVPLGIPSMELNIYDQTFRVRGSISGVRLLKVMGALEGNLDSQDTTSVSEVIIKFLSDVFLTEDRARAMQFLEDSDPPVPFSMLIEIIQWLVEQYTGNPTGQPDQSESGSVTSGSGSSVSAPSTDATSAVLTHISSSPSEPHLQAVQS